MSISARTLRLAEAAHRGEGNDATADLLRDAAARIDAQAADLEESSRIMTLSGKVNKGLMDEVLRLRRVLEKIAQTGGDSTSGDGHARCKQIARTALQEATHDR